MRRAPMAPAGMIASFAANFNIARGGISAFSHLPARFRPALIPATGNAAAKAGRLPARFCPALIPLAIIESECRLHLSACSYSCGRK